MNRNAIHDRLIYCALNSRDSLIGYKAISLTIAVHIPHHLLSAVRETGLCQSVLKSDFTSKNTWDVSFYTLQVVSLYGEHSEMFTVTSITFVSKHFNLFMNCKWEIYGCRQANIS